MRVSKIGILIFSSESLKIGIFKEKADYDLIKDILSDPVRRAMYDLGKIDKLHGTSGIPGRTHHPPGFHETARETLGDRNLARMPEIWNNVIVKAKGTVFSNKLVKI